jgi:lipase maturation factor 1
MRAQCVGCPHPAARLQLLANRAGLCEAVSGMGASVPMVQTEGEATYLIGTWLFLRFLGLIYTIAFLSLALQIKGLIGSKGILPVAEFLASQRRLGIWRFHRVPTLCWLNSSDASLMFLSWGGVALSLLMVIGMAPMPLLIALWLFYLSLFSIGRIFLGYQWDVLLLEVGFLAIFIVPVDLVSFKLSPPPVIIHWLLCWTLFRLMLSSGIVKLLSADRSWRKLVALRHHYETQPLPTPVAWYEHQMPLFFHKLSVLMMFGIELLGPFLIFGPPPVRRIAAILFIVLMFLIQLTGNYGFFNLLAVALSILLLDDQLLQPLIQPILGQLEAQTHPVFAPITIPIAILVLLLSLEPVLRLFRVDVRELPALSTLFDFFSPFHLVNSYGLFSVMTVERPEIIIEGSDDGKNWSAYEFKWKPGDPKRAPQFVAPHQPRLDWQMWFAALGYYANNPWLRRLLIRLLENSADVLSLLRSNPFPKAPPRFIRAVLFDYRFTTREQRSRTSAWWKRERRGEYSPIIPNPNLSIP